MRLFIEGHNCKLGYVISMTWSDAECSALPAAMPEELAPVRFVASRDHAFKLVARWNRRFSSHE